MYVIVLVLGFEDNYLKSSYVASGRKPEHLAQTLICVWILSSEKRYFHERGYDIRNKNKTLSQISHRTRMKLILNLKDKLSSSYRITKNKL